MKKLCYILNFKTFIKTFSKLENQSNEKIIYIRKGKMKIIFKKGDKNFMNYYPNNFYGNYSYGNSYTQMSNSAPNTFNQSYINNNLLGKIVDGEEVVKATEVPFGGYGVFPKADLSEVYIKTWNNDGTARIMKFQPIKETALPQVDTNALLLEKMNSIEDKINNLLNPQKIEEKSTHEKQTTQIEKRKELNIDAY